MKRLSFILTCLVLSIVGFTACDDEIHVTSITITSPSDDAIVMKVGEELEVSAYVLPENATNKNFSVGTSNSEIVSCRHHTIKAEKVGHVTIEVLPHGSGSIVNCLDSFEVTVIEDEPVPPTTPPTEPTPEPMTFEITAAVDEEKGEPFWAGTFVPSDDERYYVPAYTFEGELQEFYSEGAISEPTIEAYAEYYRTVLLEDYPGETPEEVLGEAGVKGTYTSRVQTYTGKHYFVAFTLGSELQLESLTSLMFLDKEEEPVLSDVKFSFGIDRVQEAAAFFAVTPDDDEQLYTFTTVSKTGLGAYAEDGETVTEMTAELAERVLSDYIDEHNAVDPAEWQYRGYGTNIDQFAVAAEDESENVYYVIAAALDDECNIFSEVQFGEIDITNLEMTDEYIGLYIDGTEVPGTYWYSTGPTDVALEIGYFVETVTLADVYSYLDSNGIDYLVEYEYMAFRLYLEHRVESEIRELMATGLDRGEATARYLDESKAELYFEPISRAEFTIEEDTFIFGHTLYTKSGAINGLEVALLSTTPEE